MVVNRGVGAAALALGLAVGGSPALAQNAPQGNLWMMCDGYGGPSTTGDGMTVYASSGIFFRSLTGGDTFRKTTGTSREAVEACDKDLADPLIAEKFPLRRASLLRARAIHLLAAGEPKTALESLDLAEKAVTEPDAFYRRSVGLGINYVRAYALAQAGEREAARELVRKTWAERPYAVDMTIAAAVLMSRTGDRRDMRELLQAQGRLDPRRTDLLFFEAFDARRWAEVVAVFPHLVPPRSFPDSPGYNFQKMKTAIDNDAKADLFWAARSGGKAVALAHLGQPQAAETALQAGREQLARATAEALPLVLNGKKVKADYLAPYAVRMNEMARKEGEDALDAAAAEVARIAREGPATGEDQGAAKPLGEAKDELDALLNTLPEVELPQRVPAYAPYNKSIFAGMGGYTEQVDAVKGTVKINYRALATTVAVSQELALLRAAEYALAQGKAGFVILDRADTQHTYSVSTYPGIPGVPEQDGYSTEIEIALVDPAAPPEAYKDAAWRVMDAQAVMAALNPVYPRPVKKARQAR